MIKLLLTVIIIIIGVMACFTFFGLPLAILYLIICFDRLVVGFSRGITGTFGIDFVTIPIIFTGILYGPYFAFIFGFVIYPITDILKWIINPPYEASWLPGIPGPDSLVMGVTGLIAGFLAGGLNFYILVSICLVAMNVMNPIKNMLVYGMPPNLNILFNFPLNFILAYLLQFILFI